jgi:hypothetical protein
VPVDDADVPDGELMLAARRLADELLRPVLRFEPIHSQKRAALLEVYQSCFGSRPSLAWAGVLTQEIQTARRTILSVSDAKASEQDPPPATTSITFEKTSRGHARHPDRPAKFPVNVRQQLLWTDGVRATVGLVGELDGVTEVLTSIAGTFGPVPPLPAAATAQSEAPLVLLRAMGRASQLGFSPPFPPYVLDLELIAWLIERVSFDGGGGSRGRLSGDRMEALLSNPKALADEVDSYAARDADRLDDDDALDAERDYAALADKIRRGTSSGVP